MLTSRARWAIAVFTSPPAWQHIFMIMAEPFRYFLNRRRARKGISAKTVAAPPTRATTKDARFTILCGRRGRQSRRWRIYATGSCIVDAAAGGRRDEDRLVTAAGAVISLPSFARPSVDVMRGQAFPPRRQDFPMAYFLLTICSQTYAGYAGFLDIGTA